MATKYLKRDEVLREIFRALSDIQIPGQARMMRVHSGSEYGDDGLQESYSEFPCCLIWPGPAQAPQIMNGHFTFRYTVRVQVLEAAGWVSERTASALPLADRVIEILALNIGLAGSPVGRLVTLCTMESDSGLQQFEFDELDPESGETGTQSYAGYEIILGVTESGAIAAALGD